MRLRTWTAPRRDLSRLVLALLVSTPACQWISGFEDFEAAHGVAGGGAAGGGATAVGGKGGVSAPGGGAGISSTAGNAGSAGTSIGGSAGRGGAGGAAGAGAPPSLGGEGGSASGGAPTGGTLSTGGEGGLAGDGGAAGTAGTAGLAGTAGQGGVRDVCTPPGGGARGPIMVPYPDAENVRFCIDQTEVTRGQYREFLEYLDTAVPQQESYCGWNGSLIPTCGGWGTAGAGAAGGGAGAGAAAGAGGAEAEGEADKDLPVACVDWCDALAFCAWAGKRLCNEASDGSAETLESEWYAACTSDATNQYPYSGTFSWYACLGSEYGASCPDSCPPFPVGTLNGCVTSAEVYDLSGNVAEWVDYCNRDQNEADICNVRGGSYLSTSDDLACRSLTRLRRDTQLSTLGFRCCASPFTP